MTETAFVIAEGRFQDAILKVKEIRCPPAEPGRDSRSLFSSVNFFGDSLHHEDWTQLRRLEEIKSDAMFVVLSDVFLDHRKVLEKLRALFAGFAEVGPVAFVLIGNFMSQPFETDADQFRHLSGKTMHHR